MSKIKSECQSLNKSRTVSLSNWQKGKFSQPKCLFLEILKRGEESNDVLSADEEFEIERLLHGYVSMCHNASMEFMKTNQ